MKTVLAWVGAIALCFVLYGVLRPYIPLDTLPVLNAVLRPYVAPHPTDVLMETPEELARDAAKPISKIGVFDCLTNSGGVITPDREHLYSLNKMAVFQSLPGGVLMQVSPQEFEEKMAAQFFGLADTAFLKTNQDFADGALLNGYLAVHIGTYEYTTKDERQKKSARLQVSQQSLAH